MRNHRAQLCSAGTVGSSCTTIAGTTGSPGQSSTELYRPGGLAFDGSGDLLIADYRNQSVQLCPYDSPGTGSATVVGTGTQGSGAAQLSFPLGVVLDGAGDYVVADRFNQRIQHCPASSPQSACSTVAGTGSWGSTATQFNEPCAVAVDSSGNFAVCGLQESHGATVSCAQPWYRLQHCCRYGRRWLWLNRAELPCSCVLHCGW